MELVRQTLFPPSALREELSTASFDDEGLWCELLVVRFVGEYRDGSAGNPDAEYMAVVVAAAVARFEVDVVVLDLRDLTYTWGDAMLGVFQVIEAADREFPLGLVIAGGAGSLPALSSLLGGPRSALDDLLTDDLEVALVMARVLAKARARAIG